MAQLLYKVEAFKMWVALWTINLKVKSNVAVGFYKYDFLVVCNSKCMSHCLAAVFSYPLSMCKDSDLPLPLLLAMIDWYDTFWRYVVDRHTHTHTHMCRNTTGQLKDGLVATRNSCTMQLYNYTNKKDLEQTTLLYDILIIEKYYRHYDEQ